MNKNKFFLRQYSFDKFFHGGIGYSDAEKIMERNGFKPISFPYHHSFSVVAKFSRLFYFLKTVLQVNKGDSFIFIYPAFAKIHRLLLKWLCGKKDVRIICFVADIDGVKDGDEILLRKEIEELKQYTYFIAHNEAMKKWLENNFQNKQIACIDFFDFLAHPFEGARQKSKEIVFAGNLAKSTFLESLFFLNEKYPDLFFNLYGPGCTNKMTSQGNVSYKGIIEPSKLPASLDGSYGLVWDGDSIEGAEGCLGNYMRYISHHKLSLYILSGLPLIVPDIAASASLIKKYNIGITISSLYEIDAAINEITEESYREMCNNMKPLADKISSGKCLSEAIEEVMDRKL